MDKKVIVKVLGLVFSLLGAVLSVGKDLLSDAEQDLVIDEKVYQAIKDESNKKDNDK